MAAVGNITEHLRVNRLDASFPSDEGGQISAVAVLSAAIFACLLLLVVNTGYATNGKIEMQNAADAAAVSGATWVARGMNLISLNNVTETQLLALVLIIPALDRAASLAQTTLQLELIGCGFLIFPAAVVACEFIINVQLAILTDVIQPIVSAMQPLADRDGVLWTAMKLLTQMSGVIATTFPAVGIAEANRIAVQNGADTGLLIPALLLTAPSRSLRLPVHAGTFNDLCDPTHSGSPSANSRGYHPLLDYPIGRGPLEEYSDTASRYLGFWLIPNSLISVYFDAFREANYRQLCGGSGAPLTYQRPVRWLDECRAAGGGTASWNAIQYDTVLLPTRQPNIAITSDSDPRLASRPLLLRMNRPCSWTPPAEPIGRGQYRRVEETVEIVGRTPDTNAPIYNYRYRVYEYSFVSATVEDEARSDQRLENRSGDSDPYPYLLGSRAGEPADAIGGELRYLAVAYRSRAISAAPRHFLSPLGTHRATYAQARVYNPTAFDTFTQDWRVALEPASMLEEDDVSGALSAPRAGGSLGQPSSILGGIAGQIDLIRLLNNH